MSVANDLFVAVPADELDDAVAALHRQGIVASEIEVRDLPPGRYPLHDERLHEDAASARRGALVGGGAGAVAGLAAAALIVGAGAYVAWLVLAFGGAALGALIGGMTGLQRAEHLDDDPQGWLEVGPDDDLRLLGVHCLHFRNRAHHILERYPGVRFLDAARPQDVVDTD